MTSSRLSPHALVAQGYVEIHNALEFVLLEGLGPDWKSRGANIYNEVKARQSNPGFHATPEDFSKDTAKRLFVIKEQPKSFERVLKERGLKIVRDLLTFRNGGYHNQQLTASEAMPIFNLLCELSVLVGHHDRDRDAADELERLRTELRHQATGAPTRSTSKPQEQKPPDTSSPPPQTNHTPPSDTPRDGGSADKFSKRSPGIVHQGVPLIYRALVGTAFVAAIASIVALGVMQSRQGRSSINNITGGPPPKAPANPPPNHSETSAGAARSGEASGARKVFPGDSSRTSGSLEHVLTTNRRYLTGAQAGGVLLVFAPMTNSAIQAELAHALAGESGAFTSDFYRDGLFDRTFEGDFAALRDSGLSGDSVVFACRSSSERTPNPGAIDPDLVRIEIRITCRELEPGRGVSRLLDVTGVGTGYSDNDALRLGVDRAVAAFKARLDG